MKTNIAISSLILCAVSGIFSAVSLQAMALEADNSASVTPTTPVKVLTKSYGGTQIPPKVLELIQKARAAGAIAYDVNETDKDGELIWNPHVGTTQAKDAMAFRYTEITPLKLQEDMADTKSYNWLSGYHNELNDKGESYQVADYTLKQGSSGSVITRYDEAVHSDYFARGSSGEKWASNCGILDDGALHCVPAMRRSETSDYILVNPDLARGKRMMYNGHIEIINGVVQSVEVSGKLAKRVAKGKASMIDPLAVLEAWEFKLAPGLRVHFGNTEAGIPILNESTRVYSESKESQTKNK